MLAPVLLCLGLAACAGEKKNVQGEADAAYKLAIAFLAEGRPTLAVRELNKAEKLRPEDPKIYNAFGEAYWRKLEYGHAEQSFLKAVELDPNYSEAWNNLGAFYISQERYEDAVIALERVVGDVLYETPHYALTNLGWALHKSGRNAEAVKRLKEALEISPGFPLAQKLLGIVLQDQGLDQDALDRFDIAERYLPEDAEIQFRRGLSLLKLGERDEARDAFERAWRLAPRSDMGKSAKNYLDFLQ